MPFDPMRGVFSDRLAKAKESIKSGILHREERIEIKCMGPDKVFFDTLNENPKLYAYISSYSFAPMIGGATVNLTYDHTDIPLEDVFVVKNPDETEDAFHRSVSAYLPGIIIIAPRGLDVASVFSAFDVAYGGFYANHTGTRIYSWSFDDRMFYFYDFEYRVGRLKLTMMENAVDKEVERLSRELFTPDMPPETKAYLAHNYLARTIEYWLKEDADSLEMAHRQSAYGALINKRCVCQGYAEAYKRLLDSQGIENYVLCGKVKGSTIGHAWNAVSFDGRVFYHVDVTWDSVGGRASDRYFCKSDAFMRSDRMWTRRTGVACPSEKSILAVAKADIALNFIKYKRQGVDPANF